MNEKTNKKTYQKYAWIDDRVLSRPIDILKSGETCGHDSSNHVVSKKVKVILKVALFLHPIKVRKKPV